VFTLSGRMEAAQIPELKELFDRAYRNIILDLRDVRLADRDAVKFLSEAGELSGVRPRVDGQRTRLRKRRTGTAVGLRFERGSQLSSPPMINFEATCREQEE
jgi:hypothetical protein